MRRNFRHSVFGAPNSEAENRRLKSENEKLKAEVAELKAAKQKLETKNATFISVLEKSAVQLTVVAEALKAGEARKAKVATIHTKMSKMLAESDSVIEATLKNVKAVETTDMMQLKEQNFALMEKVEAICAKYASKYGSDTSSLVQAGVFRRASETEKEPEAMAFNHSAQ